MTQIFFVPDFVVSCSNECLVVFGFIFTTIRLVLILDLDIKYKSLIPFVNVIFIVEYRSLESQHIFAF